MKAPEAPACESIWIVSSVRPVLEIPIATESASWSTALVSPSCTSDQEWAFTPIR